MRWLRGTFFNEHINFLNGGNLDGMEVYLKRLEVFYVYLKIIFWFQVYSILV